MSALRKLRQLKLNADVAAEPTAASSSSAAAAPVTSSEPIIEEPTRPKVNAFDMLMQDEEEGEMEEGEVQASEPAREEAESPAAASAAASASSQPKKKKEKKPSSSPTPASSKQAKKGAAAKATAAPAVPDKEEWELEFGVDSTASAAATATSSASASSSSSTTSSAWDLLRVDPKFLDAQAEIRSIFGSRMDKDPATVDNAAAVHQGPNRGGFRRGGAAARRMAGGGISARASASSRRILVRPNPQWPQTEQKGLLKCEFVKREELKEIERKAKATMKGSGVHGNIHSLNTSASEPAVTIEDETEASAASSSSSSSSATSEAVASLARYNAQQLLSLSPGVRQYTFVASRDFERLQMEYLSTVATHDVNALAYFSRSHPFHPEAALTMADIFIAQSEFTTAHEFVQRVLHVFENAFTPEFSSALVAGSARMESGSEGSNNVNTPFFTALAKHAQTLGKKGCPRTALEVSKLLLSLSPLTDPMGMLYAVDYYAIRAKQFAFLRDFPQALDRAIMSAYGVGAHPWAANPTAAAATPATSSSSSSGWSQPTPRAPSTFLPNMMYSRALAAFHLENESATASSSSSSSKSKKPSSTSSSSSAASSASVAPPTLFTGVVTPPALPSVAVGGHSMLDEYDLPVDASPNSASSSSSFLFQQALLMWPSIITPLLTAAGMESALTRSGGLWEKAITALNGLYSSGFLSSVSNASSTPYLAKLELIYAERTGPLWKSDKISTWILSNLEHLTAAIARGDYTAEVIAKFTAARSRYLLSLPFPSSVRGLQKSAYSDHVARLPPELLMAQQQAQAADLNADRARLRGAQMDAAGMQPLNLNQHPMRAFLQSLLPWFVAPDGVEIQQDRADAAAAAMPQVADAMRQLPPEQQEALLRAFIAGGENEGEGDEEDEDDGVEPADGEIAELEAALMVQHEQDEAEEQNRPIDYGDYQFEEEEEQQQ